MLHFDDTVTLFTDTYPVGVGAQTSRYGDPMRVEGDGVTVPAQVARQGRGMAKEEQVDMDRRISFYRVLVGPDVDVDGLSHCEWHGTRYEVYGEPETYFFRNGAHHIEFVIRGVRGGVSPG